MTHKCDRVPCWCRSRYAWPPGPPTIRRGENHTNAVYRWRPGDPVLRFDPKENTR